MAGERGLQPALLSHTLAGRLFRALWLPWQGQSFHLNGVLCWQCSKVAVSRQQGKREKGMALEEGNYFARFLLNCEWGLYKGDTWECRMHHGLSSVLGGCLLKPGCGMRFQRRAHCSHRKFRSLGGSVHTAGVLHCGSFWFKMAQNKLWVMEILPVLFDMVVTRVYTIVITLQSEQLRSLCILLNVNYTSI